MLARVVLEQRENMLFFLCVAVVGSATVRGMETSILPHDVAEVLYGIGFSVVTFLAVLEFLVLWDAVRTAYDSVTMASGVDPRGRRKK